MCAWCLPSCHASEAVAHPTQARLAAGRGMQGRGGTSTSGLLTPVQGAHGPEGLGRAAALLHAVGHNLVAGQLRAVAPVRSGPAGRKEGPVGGEGDETRAPWRRQPRRRRPAGDMQQCANKPAQCCSRHRAAGRGRRSGREAAGRAPCRRVTSYAARPKPAGARTLTSKLPEVQPARERRAGRRRKRKRRPTASHSGPEAARRIEKAMNTQVGISGAEGAALTRRRAPGPAGTGPGARRSSWLIAWGGGEGGCRRK